ncbi:siderophore-interacting protein [Pseudonocardia acaciae]|uniref:siderophore-interacting protein n=1 Tax=Pseudonocardia acaciae TaxID=551276 RepID=UPI000685F399|nr:siderophore-interacting protein [Pseudonocardia acaciae]
MTSIEPTVTEGTRHAAHRTLRVLRTERVTPRMARVTLGGEELAGYPPFAPDQRIKLFFPVAGQSRPAMPRASSGGPVWPPGEPRPIIRSYTVRRFDPDAGELDVDFVLHGEHGPAAEWAARAEPGDWVGVSDPGGRYRPDASAGAHLIIGDESALPAIATVLDALRDFDGPIEAYIEVADPAEEQPLPTTAATRPHWLHRGDAPPGRPLLDAVRAAELPTGVPPSRCQAWLSAEATAVRDIRAHLLDDRALPRRMIYATGYWRATRPR